MTTRQKTLRRLIAAATACLMLALSADLALAQSQAEKTGTGQPLRKLTAGATSGQGPAVAAAGGLTVGTVAAAVGVALIVGGFAIAATGGNAAASSTQ